MNNTRERVFTFLNYTLLALGVLLCVYHLYASLVGTVTVMRQRVFHVGMVVIITMFNVFNKRLKNADSKFNKFTLTWEIVSDLFILVSATVGSTYLYIIDEKIYMHISRATKFDVFIGACMVISVLEVTRRLIGWIMPAIAVASILYAKFGSLLPSIAACKGYTIRRIVSYLFLSQDGIYGTPTGVSAQTVIMFIIFGAFLTYSGAGKAL